MYRHLFLLSLLTITVGGMLNSCSQDETMTSNKIVDNNGQKIEFTLDVKSRGAEAMFENLDTIYVYGYYTDSDGKMKRCFDETIYPKGIVEFIKDKKGSSYFKSEEPIYWEKAWGDNVTFLAYAPGSHRNSIDMSQREFKVIEVTEDEEKNVNVKLDPGSHAKECFDFITAKTEVNKIESRFGIPLVFQHPLSQVELRFVTSENSEYSVDVYAATLCLANGNRSGDYNLVNQEFINCIATGKGLNWSNSAGITIETEAKSVNSEQGGVFFIPDTYKGIIVENSKFSWSKEKYQYIQLYSKVYDRNRKNVIYPTAGDSNKKFKYRKPTSSVKSFFEYYNEAEGIPWDEIGISYIVIGNEIEYKAGHKYVITVNLKDGIGYFNPADEENPGEPILSNSISAKVSIDEWSVPDFDNDAN